MKIKKRSSPKIEESGEDQKKKGLHRNLGLYLAGIFRIYSWWLALFRLIIQRSNLDRGTHFPASPLQFKYENRHRAAIKYTTSKTIPRTPTTCGGTTRPLPRDGGAEELLGDPTVGPHPKVWTIGQE